MPCQGYTRMLQIARTCQVTRSKVRESGAAWARMAMGVPMVPFTWSPPKMYTRNKKTNFRPFPYPSDRNDPFDSKNKTVRQIFDWVKIERVIILKPVQISPLGA